jgi:hypothetical protein
MKKQTMVEMLQAQEKRFNDMFRTFSMNASAREQEAERRFLKRDAALDKREGELSGIAGSVTLAVSDVLAEIQSFKVALLEARSEDEARWEQAKYDIMREIEDIWDVLKGEKDGK